MRLPIRSTRATLAVASLALALAGCAGAGSWLGMVAIALFTGLTLVAGCSEQGTTQRCCQNGRIASCICPPRTACNYVGWRDNGDGTCSPLLPGDGGADASTDVARDTGTAAETMPDAPMVEVLDAAQDPPAREVTGDGVSYQCCERGQLATCYCPPATACNYAPFRTCPDGTCYTVVPGLEPDGGSMCVDDAGIH